MSISRQRRDEIRARIIQLIGENDFSVSAFAVQEGLSVQTVYRYLQDLEKEGVITKRKTGRKNIYTLCEQDKLFRYPLQGLKEDIIWKRDAEPFFSDLPSVALANLSFAFTEILNNAVDHSNGTEVKILLRKNGYIATAFISDNGIGIFRKIADALGLEEKRFAILELAKGKFTTDPDSHTGEGIFFSSKVVDAFVIGSEDLMFYGFSDTNPYLDTSIAPASGTHVLIQIKYDHTEPMSDVFDRFTQAPDDYGFSKTVVPVRLLEYGDERPLVVSRSQAKRLMVRFEKFQNIQLDFSGVDEIGQGFADELFRVFQNQHPNTRLIPINCSARVRNMIARVLPNADNA